MRDPDRFPQGDQWKEHIVIQTKHSAIVELDENRMSSKWVLKESLRPRYYFSLYKTSAKKQNMVPIIVHTKHVFWPILR